MVVLPEHLHCVGALSPGDANYPVRWKKIKAAFSRGLPHGQRRSASRGAKGERAYGNGGIGSLPYETMMICIDTWITFIEVDAINSNELEHKMSPHVGRLFHTIDLMLVRDDQFMCWIAL